MIIKATHIKVHLFVGMDQIVLTGLDYSGEIEQGILVSVPERIEQLPLGLDLKTKNN